MTSFLKIIIKTILFLGGKMKTRIRKEPPIPNLECVWQKGYREYFSEFQMPIQVSHCPFKPEDLIKVCGSECQSYNQCADWAITHRWENFTCQHCPTYTGTDELWMNSFKQKR